MRLTGMTIHRLMSVIASEQIRLRRDDQPSDTTAATTAATATSLTPSDDRNDAAAEQ